MSVNYSANQYERSYKPPIASVCRPCRQRPTALEGHTSFIADDRGHLMPGVSKRGSSWPAFKGTWDLPARLPPAQSPDPTGRSAEGWSRLQALHGAPRRCRSAQPPGGSREPAGQVEVDAQQDSSATNAAAATPPPPAPPTEEEPASQEGQQPPQV